MSDPGKAAAGQQLGSQMLQAALQTAVGAIIIIDDKGLIRTLNPAVEKMFGFSDGELIGRNVNVLMPKPFRRPSEQAMTYLADTDPDLALGSLQAAACTYRIALGPRARQKVLSLQTVPSQSAPPTQGPMSNQPAAIHYNQDTSRPEALFAIAQIGLNSY